MVPKVLLAPATMPPAPHRTAWIRRILRRPSLALWAVYLLTLPIYVTRGGLPKPADALIFLLIPAAFSTWDGRLEKHALGAFRALMLFTGWVVLVNAAWMLLLDTTIFDALYPMYYIYNALVFLAVSVLYRRHGDDFLRLTERVVYAAVFIQIAISFVYRGHTFRNSLFFDNPNQLGYYALLIACIISVLQRRLGSSVLRTSIGLTGCGYLAVMSASRSAVAGIAVLVILLVFSNLRVILMASVVAGALVLAGGPVADAIDSMQQRVVDKQAQATVGFLEQRGYDRILANKEYLLLGAGEQAKSRFAESTRIGRAEIHSSVGTLVFGYGIIGFVLFSVFLYRVIRGAPVRSSMILMAPLIYALGHQGLRFSTFWILLAVFVALKSPSNPSFKPRARVPSLPQPVPVPP